MLKKKTFLLFIVFICLIEIIIYFWATWTTEAEFVFDKCARNSGRASSAINLGILLMIGYFGLKRIYGDAHKMILFKTTMTLFAFNHLIHFFYVYQNFRHHSMELSISQNLHGFITFVCVLALPVILWNYKRLHPLLYIGIILHLFNVSYFIMETFYSKIKPDHPAYHNQLGIAITTAAMLYILYRVFREISLDKSKNASID